MKWARTETGFQVAVGRVEGYVLATAFVVMAIMSIVNLATELLSEKAESKVETTETFVANDPGALLEGYVENELGENYLGHCPREFDPSPKVGGICSKKIASADDSLTYFLGRPYSDAWGKAVLTKQGDEWSLEFEPLVCSDNDRSC